MDFNYAREKGIEIFMSYGPNGNCEKLYVDGPRDSDSNHSIAQERTHLIFIYIHIPHIKGEAEGLPRTEHRHREHCGYRFILNGNIRIWMLIFFFNGVQYICPCTCLYNFISELFHAINHKDRRINTSMRTTRTGTVQKYWRESRHLVCGVQKLYSKSAVAKFSYGRTLSATLFHVL